MYVLSSINFCNVESPCFFCWQNQALDKINLLSSFALWILWNICGVYFFTFYFNFYETFESGEWRWEKGRVDKVTSRHRLLKIKADNDEDEDEDDEDEDEGEE